MYSHFRYTLFGFPVDSFNKRSLLEFINEKISKNDKVMISHLNLHGIYCLLKSADMSALFTRPQTFIHIDGMPIVVLLRLKGANVDRNNRLTYLDWATDLISLAAENRWRIAYVGSTPEICSNGIRYFESLHPNLTIRGWDGYFDMVNSDSKLLRMLTEISEYRADLLIVGMGMPRQEIFLHSYFDQLDFKVALCSGAFFEYFVGGQAMPPRWAGRLGFESLYRLLANPRRYTHRYLIEPWIMAYLLLKRRFSGR
jgi:N-acetylglucosaminyldiphosphoundecaprenol N-acetyl-beta-D-mannosaminyltransferase